MRIFDKIKGYAKKKGVQRAKDREYYNQELAKARVKARKQKIKIKRQDVRDKAQRKASWESKTKIEKIQVMGKKLGSVGKKLNKPKKGKGKQGLFESGDDYFN